MISHQSNYLLNNRNLTMLHKDIEDEIHIDTNQNYLFNLSYLSLFKVSGTNASDFLQGQLTCNMDDLSEEKALQGAMCNLKGRIVALVDLIKWNDCIYLLVPRDISASVVTSLNKTAMFSKVSINEVNNLSISGFYYGSKTALPFFNHSLNNLAKLQAIAEQDRYCFNLGDNCFIFITDEAIKNQLYVGFKDLMAGELLWHYLNLSHGRFSIYPESQKLFLPHRVGLQNSGHLNFNKGCYKGQEIIARTHYKAKLKHEFNLFCLESTEVIYSGQKIFNAEGSKEIAEIIDYCPIKDNKYIIATSILKDFTFEKVKLEKHEQLVPLQNFKPSQT